ncbi:hypothetical protein RHGRI_014654 [Rhododendron griersonianum]|uniref:Transposase n=1 Tax=Rhododendron griersonianum TaxID=479676 RepID=A0AAV6KA88_9ERIC|nr:hypothetical protein RHGRI_014654 [Rhododendron griersonianum]
MGDGRVQLNIKFGGKFVGNPVNSYIDGDICYSRVVPYEFSYNNLLEVLFQVGCMPGLTFFYLRPNHMMEDGLFMVSNDVDMTEMFVLHDGLARDIECFVSHPDVENDEEEELGWEGVPPGFEHDEEEEELGGAGNGNEEEVQNIRWEGGQCGDDDTNKGASDDDTDSDGDSDGACSGLRDSSSSDGDDIEDVVVTREASPCPLIPTGRKDVSSGVRRGRGAGRGVPRGRGLSRGRGVAIGVPTSGGRGVAIGVPTGGGVGRGVAARGGVSRGKEVVVATRGVSRGKPVVVAAWGRLSRGKGMAVQTGGDRAVEIGGTRKDQTGASGVARAIQIGAQPSLPTFRNGKKVIFKSALGGGYQPGWKIATIGDGIFSSQVYNGITKGSTQ